MLAACGVAQHCYLNVTIASLEALCHCQMGATDDAHAVEALKHYSDTQGHPYAISVFNCIEVQTVIN